MERARANVARARDAAALSQPRPPMFIDRSSRRPLYVDDYGWSGMRSPSPFPPSSSVAAARPRLRCIGKGATHTSERLRVSRTVSTRRLRRGGVGAGAAIGPVTLTCADLPGSDRGVHPSHLGVCEFYPHTYVHVCTSAHTEGSLTSDRVEQLFYVLTGSPNGGLGHLATAVGDHLRRLERASTHAAGSWACFLPLRPDG